MPDFWMDVDTALPEVPVNVMPLLDSTDFKTIEDAIAYDAAGIALFWHFVTTAGAYTVTAVTPTSGGDYDWTDQGTAGIYTIEIPASGGASINNDTEGFGWFTGSVTGVLPWRGPTIGFRAAALNNLLIDDALSATRGLSGTALPDAAAEAAGGLYTRGSGAGQINQPGNGLVDVSLKAILNTALTETAGYLAAGFKKFFNVASPTGTVNSLPDHAITTGTVSADAGNTASTFKTSLSQTATDHWKYAFLTFTSGALAGQTRQVTGYNGSTKVVTTVAFSAAPSTSDAFLLVNR